MELQTLGTHAGSGLIATILTYCGFKQRLDKLDERFETLENKVVFKDVHDECSKSRHEQIEQINAKLDVILTRLMR